MGRGRGLRERKVQNSMSSLRGSGSGGSVPEREFNPASKWEEQVEIDGVGNQPLCNTHNFFDSLSSPLVQCIYLHSSLLLRSPRVSSLLLSSLPFSDSLDCLVSSSLCPFAKPSRSLSLASTDDAVRNPPRASTSGHGRDRHEEH